MTPDTNPAPVFDFDAAVSAARRDYPLETSRVTFIDLAAPDAGQELKKWLSSASPAFIQSFAEKGDTAEAALYHAAEKFLLKNGLAEVDYATGNILVAASSKPSSKYLGSTATQAQQAAYVFAHELGHAVTRNGFTPDWRGTHDSGTASLRGTPTHEKAEAEMAADVFAILRCLSQQTITVEQAQEVSLRRALKPPGVHTTSPALDAAIRNLGHAQFSPAGVQAMAEKIAKRHAPAPGEIEELSQRLSWLRTVQTEPQTGPEMTKKLKSVFDKIRHRAPRSAALPDSIVVLRRLTPQEWLENVAEVFNRSPKNSLAAIVTAKVLASTPHPQKPGKAQTAAYKKLNRRKP